MQDGDEPMGTHTSWTSYGMAPHPTRATKKHSGGQKEENATNVKGSELNSPN